MFAYIIRRLLLIIPTLIGIMLINFVVTNMAPGGPIRALHLRRPVPSGSDDPEIDVWLGSDFDMLPVRLRIQDSGSRVLDQLIERDG